MIEPDDSGVCTPQLNSLDCWDYSIELECLRGPEDLQLAAELGKTLLERNKELETSVKQHQNIIEDQTQEIEYLTKQTVALREVNDSRLRIYEQLEVSIHELERANHRLTRDNAADKKQIKNLCATIGTLEAKCDEMQTTIEQLGHQLDSYKRKCQQWELESSMNVSTSYRGKYARTQDEEHDWEVSQDKQIQCDSTSNMHSKSCGSDSTGIDQCDSTATAIENEQMNQMLHDMRTQRSRDECRIVELEQHIAALVQDNQRLEKQLVDFSCKEEDMKSMHEELTTLDEVRRGQLCVRCLRNIDDQVNEDVLILEPEEEEEDISMMDALISETRYHSSMSLNIQQDQTPEAQSNNLYRDLVEKYEALLAVNRAHKPPHPMSLHEELQISGDFNHLHAKDTDEESGHGDTHYKRNRRQTPTDFSEAETSSSGFADETSNKSTQTDGRPGSFLCTIADGEDCRFSIYDDASPIDSRFRNRPEYRELFKEIFTVLKKAAENKDEGEELPLLDDCTPVAPKVPPVTPATEDLPGDFTDDNQSVISDISVQSIEPETIAENSLPEEPKQGEQIQAQTKTEVVLTPYKREPLEYLSVAVNVRKKSSSKKNNKKFADRSDSPILPLSPRISYLSQSRKRKEQRSNTNPDLWNGSTLQFWSSNRNVASPTPSQNSNKSGRYEKNTWDFKPSTASQDLNKLKRLDLSYAEVLRNADNKKREREVITKTVRRK